MNIGGCACGGVNCPHCNPNLWLPPVTLGNATLQHLTERIKELEAENQRLREALEWIEDACGNSGACQCGRPTGVMALKTHALRALLGGEG